MAISGENAAQAEIARASGSTEAEASAKQRPILPSTTKPKSRRLSTPRRRRAKASEIVQVTIQKQQIEIRRS